jgi:hypothetical protein
MIVNEATSAKQVWTVSGRVRRLSQSNFLARGQVLSVKVVEIEVEFEVAIGQVAMGGSLSSSVSSKGGVSSAVPSICM